MSLFKQFKMDPTKENEGVLITYGPNDDGSIPTFRIARRSGNNQRYAKSLMQESQPYRRMIDLGVLPQATSEKVFRRVFCSSVLLGWENVQDDETKQLIPFNIDNAMHLMQALPDLYDDLVAQSTNIALFRLTEVEDAAKNS